MNLSMELENALPILPGFGRFTETDIDKAAQIFYRFRLLITRYEEESDRRKRREYFGPI